MYATFLHPELGDDPVIWVLIVAFLFVFIAAVVIISVWVARLISRVKAKK